MLLPNAIVQREGDEWQFTWPTAEGPLGKLSIHISNLHESGGDLYAELQIKAHDAGTEPNAPRHVFGPTRFNLLAPRGRTEFVGYMVKRIGSQIQELTWILLMEQVCCQVVRDFRAGEPLLTFTDMPEVGPVDYIVQKMLPRNETTILASAGGEGKGWVALGLSLAFASGGIWGQTLLTYSKPKERNVLYLDWEENEMETARRLQWLCHGLKWPQVPDRIIYRQMHRPIVDEISLLRAEAVRNNVGLVIIDSLVPATTGDPNKPESARETMNALRLFSPATRLVLGHFSKADVRGEHKATQVFGSIFFQNMARNYWEMQADGEGDEIRLGFIHRKVNVGRRQKPFGLTLLFDDDSHKACFLPGRIEDVPTAMLHIGTRYRIRLALACGKKTTKELAAELGETPESIRAILRRDSRIIRLGRDGRDVLWGLRAEGTQSPSAKETDEENHTDDEGDGIF